MRIEAAYFYTTRIAAFYMVCTIVPNPYLDEIFHVPQALKYCHGDYHSWDSKITTPPGLYLLAAGCQHVLTFARISIASTLGLRFLNFLIGTLCLPIALNSITLAVGKEDNAYFLSGFPLVTFFSFLFYTDVASTVLVISGIAAAFKQQKLKSSGTNIVWICYAVAISTLKDLSSSQALHNPDWATSGYRDLILSLSSLLKCCSNERLTVTRSIAPFMPACLGFAFFLWWNKGIALGDRENHIPGIHAPQLFYLATFCAVFAFSTYATPRYVMVLFRRICGRPSRILKSAAFLGLIVMVVFLNTKEHPFLLADNRHYVFYLWRRTVRASNATKYGLAPLCYLVSLFIVSDQASSESVLSMLAYMASCILILLPAPLIEFRYFIIPYLVWRVRMKARNSAQKYAEFIAYEIVNYSTLYLFLFRPFKWASVPFEQQRFMW